jgi:hypothetical protein
MNGTSGNTLQNGTISASAAHIRGDLESEELNSWMGCKSLISMQRSKYEKVFEQQNISL